MQHWHDIIRNAFGINGRLVALAGEYDLNFRLETEGADYVLKIMHAGCDVGLVEMQIAALSHVAQQDAQLPVPQVVPTVTGENWIVAPDQNGADRILWLQQLMPGISLAAAAPQAPKLLQRLGQSMARLDRALEGFEHPNLTRDFKWDLTNANWIAPHIAQIDDRARQEILRKTVAHFDKLLPRISELPKAAIHNDINDYNVLVDVSLSDASQQNAAISGLIDFGDMMLGPRVVEIAIAGAYAVMGQQYPERALADLVAGYHAVSPLDADELALIYPALRMRLAVTVVNAALRSQEAPDDPYVTISSVPAWDILERAEFDAAQIEMRLRVACGYEVVPGARETIDYLAQQRGNFAPLMGQDLSTCPMGSLAVEHSTTPENPFDLAGPEAAVIGADITRTDPVWLGYYGEPRLIYTAPFFNIGPWRASDRRTVHMAVDGFAPAGTPLLAPLAGIVETVENRAAHLDYGGMVILRHETPQGRVFFTLYGHLDPQSIAALSKGDPVAKGAEFATLGAPDCNGGWAPHVHFQLALTTAGMGADWPGVADPDDWAFWQEICPNPAALMNLDDEKVLFQPLDQEQILQSRQAHFGGNLSLSYDRPKLFLRGWEHHLFDAWGRPHLDCYNNVPHVGHAHPRLRAVAADQLARMNSNTRYLHPAQTEFADKILSKMPDGFTHCYFVNSGTEANELALRMARAATGGIDMITPDHGYHGNTTGAVAISAYKFNKPGGIGQADWVHLVDVADSYRGAHRGADAGEKYANQVQQALGDIAKRGGRLAGFIAETFPSVGGQIVPPPRYLAEVYRQIRTAGGICIADEVQTGLGRLGRHYFAFEQQKVTPDIVVLGKPIGNGHPIGVVVTTADIAAKFDNGIEYFSTFGGSNLSCRMGKEVLDIVDDQKLQENAEIMGKRLFEGLQKLQQRHEFIGDLRGMGLFVGVDLVRDRGTRVPATDVASYVINRLALRRVLIGAEGPADNVLKIRPPLTIDAEGIDMILDELDRALAQAKSWLNL